MMKPLFCLFLVALPLVALSQSANISRIGEFALDFRPDGSITVQGPTPRGKVTATLTGNTKPVSLVALVSGTAALKKAGLKARRRELEGRKIVVHAQDVNVKGKQARVTDATLTRDVLLLLEETTLEGEKSTTKIRCDEAVFKAGPKPGMGRLDFSGNVHAWGFGGMGSGELLAKSGWVELGDPDDLENHPMQYHLEAANVTGTPTPQERKGKS